MSRVLTRFGAAAVVALVVACGGGEFQSGGAGGAGGLSNAGGSAGSGKGGSTSGGSSTGGSSSGGSSSGGSSSGGTSSGGTSSGGTSSGGGSGACVSGGACAPEGSTCVDDPCCPCSYECRDGKWAATVCADCAAPACPPEPPSDGQACGGCQDPIGRPCAWELCSTDLGRYSATCDGSTWAVTVQPCGEGCCTGDDECASLICVNGVCKEALPNGCWRDHECGPNQICVGASVCPCGAECFVPDSPGTCAPSNLGCCSDTVPCPNSSQRCVEGVCKDTPPQGQCWWDFDCPAGNACKGASVCGCGQACPGIDSPGTCG